MEKKVLEAFGKEKIESTPEDCFNFFVVLLQHYDASKNEELLKLETLLLTSLKKVRVMTYLIHVFKNWAILRTKPLYSSKSSLEKMIFSGLDNLCIRNLSGEEEFPYRTLEFMNGAFANLLMKYGGDPALKMKVALQIMLMIKKPEQFGTSTFLEHLTKEENGMKPILIEMKKAGLIFEEAYDSFMCTIEKKPFPTILPKNDDKAINMGPKGIKKRLCQYMGIKESIIDKVLTEAQFQKEGDDVGQIIYNDLLTLKKNGTTRADVARVLLKLADRGSNEYNKKETEGKKFLEEEVNLEFIQTRGFHEESFHISFAESSSYMEPKENSIRGSADVTVTSKKEKDVKFSYGDMLPYLVRVAGYFEGNVPYRTDPNVVCKIIPEEEKKKSLENENKCVIS